MTKRASKEFKNNWRQQILRQRQSGISVAAWCRQNNIAKHSFFYWQGKLFSQKPLDRSAFTEIPDEKLLGSASGITLEVQGVKIHIDPQFDSPTLRKCVEILKTC